MKQLKIYHPWIALCLLTLMAYACTGKIEKPQTHEEQLAAIEVTITGAYRSVERLALDGVINTAQFDNIMAEVEKRRRLFESSQDLHSRKWRYEYVQTRLRLLPYID